MELGIKGKVAMVAAASQGLGFAIAKALAAEGAQVSMAARKAETILAAAARIVEQTGAEAMGWVADVMSAEAIEGWHGATVERFGGVDLLVTNSGGPAAGAASGFDDAGGVVSAGGASGGGVGVVCARPGALLFFQPVFPGGVGGVGGGEQALGRRPPT